MDFFLPLLLAPVIVVAASIFFLSYNSLTVFLHELGHALPLLLLTKQNIGILLLPNRKATMYLSKGKVGRLEMAIPWNQVWIGQVMGICILPHPERVTALSLACYVISGPIVTLAITTTFVLLLFSS